MKIKVKIKDLPKDDSLGGIAFKHPETGEKCFWKSQWQKGVWFTKEPAATQVFPLFLEDLTHAAELEVLP